MLSAVGLELIPSSNTVKKVMTRHGLNAAKQLIALVFFVSVPPLCAQEVPPGCAIDLISLATVSGPAPYQRLRYEIEALSSAQRSVVSLSESLKDFQAAADPSMGLSTIITGTNDAEDALHCSSTIMAKYTPVDDDDDAIRKLMIQAFDQEADAIADLQGDLKRKILLAVGQSNETTDVGKNAEIMSAIQAKQKYAAESLLIGVQGSLMLAVDLSDMKAKNTAKTVLTCAEFKELRGKAAAISSGEKSAYGDSASLFVTFLGSHECLPR